MNFKRVLMILLATLLLPGMALAQTTTRATFEVIKVWDEPTPGNPASVKVTLDCFTGLPITQSQNITAAQGVTFVVTSFADGELDCSVTEADVAGYGSSYSCDYENVTDGTEEVCTIANSPDPVEVTVNKDWVIDGSGGDALDPTYRIALLCSSPIDGGEVCDFASTSTSKFGSSVQSAKLPIEACYFKELTPYEGVDSADDASYTALVIPDWEYGTLCVGAEIVYDSSVEQDTLDCEYEGMVFGIGGEGDAECTITNTVFYEGIPTLSQYGMAIMALLMLGVGLLGFRRLV